MTVTGQDRGKVQILMMTGAPDYCRRDNTGGGSFDNLDTQVAKLPIVTAENQNLIADTNDVFYLGCDTLWYGFGVCLNTFGDYGTGIYYEYYNDDEEDWVEFEPLYDSTEMFSAHGVVVWGDLENWGALEVNGQSAYWIRIKSTSVTTAAKWYNFLRNVTIHEPFKLETKTLNGGLFDDIQGNIQKTDITDYGNRGFLSLTDLDIMSCSQEDIHNLKKWERDRDQLWIVDLARTDPVDFSVDAFIRNYVGYCTAINGAVESPHKEAFPFAIEFKFEDIVTGSDAVGSEVFEDQGGELGYDWTRDSAEADSTSDGGDNFNTG